MEPPRKPSVVPILIGLVAAGSALAFGGWLLYRKLPAETFDTPGVISMPLPAELKKPRVLEASEKFSKREFAYVKGLGLVTDMRLLGGDLIFAGTSETARADAQGRTKGNPVLYPGTGVTKVNIVPLKGGPDYDLFAFAPVMSGLALMDRSGKVLWSTSRDIESAAAGDLEGRGMVSIALGKAAGEGIELLDATGKMRWRAPGSNPWDVEIIEGDRGTPARIVYSNSKGTLTLRDAAGKSSTLSIDDHVDFVVTTDSSGKRSTSGVIHYLDRILPFRWPDAAGKAALLIGGENAIFALGLDGEIIGSRLAPMPSKNVTTTRPVSACRVAFKPGREYLAVFIQPAPYDERSALFIYDPDGRLVHAELLAQPAGALLAIPRPGGAGAETLLVGGTDAVFAYDL